MEETHDGGVRVANVRTNGIVQTDFDVPHKDHLINVAFSRAKKETKITLGTEIASGYISFVGKLEPGGVRIEGIATMPYNGGMPEAEREEAEDAIAEIAVSYTKGKIYSSDERAKRLLEAYKESWQSGQIRIPDLVFPSLGMEEEHIRIARPAEVIEALRRPAGPSPSPSIRQELLPTKELAISEMLPQIDSLPKTVSAPPREVMQATAAQEIRLGVYDELGLFKFEERPWYRNDDQTPGIRSRPTIRPCFVCDYKPWGNGVEREVDGRKMLIKCTHASEISKPRDGFERKIEVSQGGAPVWAGDQELADKLREAHESLKNVLRERFGMETAQSAVWFSKAYEGVRTTHYIERGNKGHKALMDSRKVIGGDSLDAVDRILSDLLGGEAVAWGDINGCDQEGRVGKMDVVYSQLKGLTPIGDLPGIGRQVVEKFEGLGFKTAEQLVTLAPEPLSKALEASIADTEGMLALAKKAIENSRYKFVALIVDDKHVPVYKEKEALVNRQWKARELREFQKKWDAVADAQETGQERDFTFTVKVDEKTPREIENEVKDRLAKIMGPGGIVVKVQGTKKRVWEGHSRTEKPPKLTKEIRTKMREMDEDGVDYRHMARDLGLPAGRVFGYVIKRRLKNVLEGQDRPVKIAIMFPDRRYIHQTEVYANNLLNEHFLIHLPSLPTPDERKTAGGVELYSELRRLLLIDKRTETSSTTRRLENEVWLGVNYYWDADNPRDEYPRPEGDLGEYIRSKKWAIFWGGNSHVDPRNEKDWQAAEKQMERLQPEIQRRGRKGPRHHKGKKALRRATEKEIDERKQLRWVFDGRSEYEVKGATSPDSPLKLATRA